jgi:hypothetical protein
MAEPSLSESMARPAKLRHGNFRSELVQAGSDLLACADWPATGELGETMMKRSMLGRRLAIALGALALGGTALLTQPVQAQWGGYERPRQDYYEERQERRSYRGESERRGYRGGDDDGARRGGGMARGSFARTCRDIEQNGPYLSATCRGRGGGWYASQIDTRACRTIANVNGRLACE